MITLDDALTCDMFYSVSQRNADGTAVRWRRNGQTKVWKRRTYRHPDGRVEPYWRVPVKHGLRSYDYLTPEVATAVLTYDPTDPRYADPLNLPCLVHG